MIDARKLKYKIIGILEDGTQLDITGATEDQGWEEGEGELALRINLTIHNTKYRGQYLSDILKPGCIIAIVADWGDGTEEVARGSIVDWDTTNRSSEDTFSILSYDELFNFQNSQDNVYITAGTGTKAALTAIFSDWGIPVGEYKGPDVAHAKTLFKNEYLSDMVEQLLDDAVKQGAPKCIIRAVQGAIHVLPEGSNTTIYHFDEDSNIEVTKDKVSTQGLVTRVKVVGKEDSEGRQPVEAIIDGQTELGIHQRIYNRQENDSLATAKMAAQEIITNSEADTRTTSIQGPDVPPIRRGDMTERFTRLSYTTDIGTEMIDALNQEDREAIQSAVERTITEALMVNPKTEYVRGFSFSWEGDALFCTCIVKGHDWEEFSVGIPASK